MSFDSVAFLFFFPVAVLGYYLCPARFRWAFLLAASCYFYAAFVPKYIFILFFLIGVDYVLARVMEGSRGKLRHTLLVCSILSNVGILFVFKYFNFFNINLTLLAHALDWNYSAATLRLVLPLGLSFHTFQSLSYVIEVYRGKYPAEKHLGVYALYVMFFPQLVAGPIERPQHLLEQLKRLDTVRFNPRNAFSGVWLMAWGFFKKIVIADRLALSVNYIYSDIMHVSGPSALAAVVFFSFQLYTDFSGYSDIARGAARTMGVDVVNNFRQPYFSKSIAEFWRRWHISLSSWFRDYVYIPLGGNRAGDLLQYRNILIVFLLSGLWHGAAWTFVMMGFLFGTYIVVGTVTVKWREHFVRMIGLDCFPRIHQIVQIFVTFALASLAWVFFRAPDMQTALTLIGRLFVGWGEPFSWFINAYVRYPFDALGIGRIDLFVVTGSILFLLIVEYIQTQQAFSQLFDRQSLLVQAALYTSLVLALLLFGVFTTNQFIYFQF